MFGETTTILILMAASFLIGAYCGAGLLIKVYYYEEKQRERRNAVDLDRLHTNHIRTNRH